MLNEKSRQGYVGGWNFMENGFNTILKAIVPKKLIVLIDELHSINIFFIRIDEKFLDC